METLTIRKRKNEKMSISQLSKINSVLAHHEKFRNSYFWSPYGSAGQRRKTETDNSFTIQFKHLGNTYKYVSSVSCSCRNIYYTGFFYLNDQKKNVTLFKKLINN